MPNTLSQRDLDEWESFVDSQTGESFRIWCPVCREKTFFVEKGSRGLICMECETDKN